jgi:hypothetical protein
MFAVIAIAGATFPEKVVQDSQSRMLYPSKFYDLLQVTLMPAFFHLPVCYNIRRNFAKCRFPNFLAATLYCSISCFAPSD